MPPETPDFLHKDMGHRKETVVREVGRDWAALPLGRVQQRLAVPIAVCGFQTAPPRVLDPGDLMTFLSVRLFSAPLYKWGI